MAVIIGVITVIAAIIFILWQQSAGEQIKKGYKLIESKHWEDAIVIFERHFASSPLAPAGLANALLGRADAGKYDEGAYRKILELGSKLSASADVPAYSVVEAKAGLKIAKEMYEAVQFGSGRLEALKDGLAFTQRLRTKGSEKDFQSLISTYQRDIAYAYYSKAKEHEKRAEYDHAFEEYRLAYSTNTDESLLANIAVRKEICRSKKKEIMLEVTIKQLSLADPGIQADYRYRRTLQYIDAGNFKDARTYLTKIPGKKLVDQLKAFIHNEEKKSILAEVNGINNSISLLHEQKLGGGEIEELYQRLEAQHKRLIKIYPEIAEQLSELRPAIFNRLLVTFTKENRHSEAAALITSYPDFWKNPELLKGLAQTSIGIVSSGKLSKANYQDVLSSWITVACSDQVLLHSLEVTSWDDDFTFTLDGALGSAYEFHSELPDNVNYDPADESNISIGDTQRELIAEFEKLLNAYVTDKALLESALSFYHAESDAIKRVVTEVAQEILFAAPHFAKRHGLSNGIIQALESDYSQYSNESALEAARLYGVSGVAGSAGKYSIVKDQTSACLKAIDNSDSVALHKIAKSESIKHLSEFGELKKRFELDCVNAFKASKDLENKVVIDCLEAVLIIFPSSEQLKYLLCIQVASIVIDAVNSGRMSHFDAFLCMMRGYKVDPENTRVATNIVKLVEMNLMDVVNDKTRKETEIFAEIDKLKKNLSNAFKAAAGELSETRLGIINELNKSGQDVSWIISKTAPANLTPSGRKLRKVLNTMLELSGGPTRPQTMEDLLRSLNPR